jgi:hypothetical protein
MGTGWVWSRPAALWGMWGRRGEGERRGKRRGEECPFVPSPYVGAARSRVASFSSVRARPLVCQVVRLSAGVFRPFLVARSSCLRRPIVGCSFLRRTGSAAL